MVGKRAVLGDNWEHGVPYERYVGRWSRQLAPRFLAWLNLPPGQHWLDLGCGTGALCAAILDRCVPASVTGVEPSEGFLQIARQHLDDHRAAFHPGNATAIPLPDAAVDVVVSALVLNFVPEAPAALREMARVSRSGGTIAAYVWDYAGKMDMLRRFWDAAGELDAAATALDEGRRFPLCQPEALQALFAGAGLNEVQVQAIDIPTRFADFDDYWQPFLGGQGPAPAYVTTLDAPARSRLRERIRDQLPTDADGSISLNARAWAVRAAGPI